MKNTAIITGADGGMGSEITQAVARSGYHVIMLCRSAESGEIRKQQIIKNIGTARIEVIEIDLSSMAVTSKVVRQLLQQKDFSIDLLMNNAGTMCNHFTRTSEGFEQTVAVNYLAPFLLTNLLLPRMHTGSRIVNMVSCTYAIGKIAPCFFEKGRQGNFWRIPIYSNTKLALWLFTKELAKRIKTQGITVNAADPGIVSTNMIRMNMWFDPLTDIFFRPFIRTPRQGADTAIRLLLNEQYQGITGEMFISGKQKHLKPYYHNHPQAITLWNDTQEKLTEFFQ